MNKVEILGRMTKDVETRTTPNGKIIASFGVAVNRRFTKQGEERQADFFNLIAFGQTGEFIQKYFHKGQPIALVGRLQNNNYEDKEGKKHYTNEIIVEEVYFAGGESKKETKGDAWEEPSFIMGDDELSDLPF